MKKRGQITVFIILGLLMLFGAIFLFQIVKNVKTSSLESEQEKIVSKAFQKEGLRLYVEDCLKDELEKGIILIGKQGRVWSNQGGSITFIDGSTGRKVMGDNVSYGITQGTYFDLSQYPCLNGVEPDFCKYRYPNGSIMPDYSVKFGERKIDLNLIKSDLEKYLINQTIVCVENYTKKNISGAAKVTVDNPKIDLEILNEGIQVAVDYPLKLGLNGQEYFHLAKFDFFYSTQLKGFLDSMITRPLNFDQSVLDFNYTPKTLSSGSFMYNLLENEGVTNRTVVLKAPDNLISFDKTDLGNGDDLFRFTASGIVGSKYLFQFVRQNRAPALDYVEMHYCDAQKYDYLVIKDDAQLGSVNITLLALDPDEDSVKYSFDGQEIIDTDESEAGFLAIPTSTGFYNISANVSDENEGKDSQVVRVLVDRSMKTGLSLSLPYNIGYYSGDRYIISKEDPVFISVTLPEDSIINEKPKVTLKYTGELENFALTVPQTSGDNCFSFPWLLGCTLDKYDADFNGKELIENWDYFLTNYKEVQSVDGGFNHFSDATSNFGLLELNYSVTYCGKVNQSDTSTVRVEVKDCVAQRNATYPYAYPYHNLRKDAAGNWYKDTLVNPFLSDHTCCLGTPNNPNSWKLAGTDTVCYEGAEESGCFGGSSILSSRKLSVYCDGVRGNICGGEQDYSGYTSTGKCGTAALGCQVASACEKAEPFSLVSGGWCYGTDGCGSVCTSEIVDKGSNLGFSADTLKKNSAQYGCGCDEEYEENKCYDLSEKKEGVCEHSFTKGDYCEI